MPPRCRFPSTRLHGVTTRIRLYIIVVTNVERNERKGNKTEERKKSESKIDKKANYIKWQIRIIQQKATKVFCDFFCDDAEW